MATETADLSVEILRRMQADMAELRRDVMHVQQSQVDTIRIIGRLDARLSDVKQDLESMLKMEIIGALTHHATRMEQILADSLGSMTDRLQKIEAAVRSD